MIHILRGFGIVNETDVDVFLEPPCFLCDPENVCSLNSGSSAFSKPSWSIWKFLVHVMLKPSLTILSITLLAQEMSAIAQWLGHSLVLPFFEIGIRIDLFPSCGHCFPNSLYIECSSLIASYFRILNSPVEFHHLY